MTDIDIVGETNPLMELAAAELGRYVGQAPVAPEDTPRFILDHSLSGIHPQGYVVSTEDATVTIAAAQPIGVLYGVYGYLEEVRALVSILGATHTPILMVSTGNQSTSGRSPCSTSGAVWSGPTS